jgi:molybdate transport system substrate-binding protein
VLAAASLTDTFTDLAATFEEQHPGVEVRVSFGSSTTLAHQAADGAPGDVLATADERSMQVAVDAGAVIGSPQVFASNELSLVTPADDAAGVDGVVDLDREDVDFVTCVATAPCGALARELLANARVEREPVSEEVDVKAVLARVVDGEADAGIVYRSDAVAAGDRVSTAPLRGLTPSTLYPVARLSDDGPAQDFIDLVLSEPGQAVLAEAGFGQAPGRVPGLDPDTGDG